MSIRRSEDSAIEMAPIMGVPRKHSVKGFTLLELLLVIAVSLVLAAIAIPMMNSALANMRLNSAVNQLAGAISTARFQAIKNSQIYTLVLTTPANTYVVTDTGPPVVAAASVPLPSAVTFGSSGTYTFTLCPNGMVYGAGGCPNANAPPSLTASYQQQEVTITVSGVGNVTTTKVQ